MAIDKTDTENGVAAVHRIVLAGGPCGGKTTVQSILVDLFMNMGWKVFRVPETATILLAGGVNFSELNHEQAYQFQKDLLRVMVNIEDTYMNLAKSFAAQGQKSIVICDRGAMDSSAYIDRPSWLRMLQECNLQEVELRDARYDCVVHLVSAAKGAEKFYTTADHSVRSEGITLAREIDDRIRNAWLGHPYMDVVDNSTGFDEKMHRVVEAICKRLSVRDNRSKNVVKRKFLLKEWPKDDAMTVKFEDFDVQHYYLLTSDGSQARIRKRGQNGVFSYTLTIRRPDVAGQPIETRRNLNPREYEALLAQVDPSRVTVLKTRRCFVYNDQYLQLDLYKQPNEGLALLEAYVNDGRRATSNLDFIPPFVGVVEEVTGKPDYSMYKLCLKKKEI